MKAKNILRLTIVSALSIFMFACASQKKEAAETSNELSFSEFDENPTNGVTIDEMAGDEMAGDEMAADEETINDNENLETNMPELPGDEQAEGIEEIDETIVKTPPPHSTYQKTSAYKPYSRAGIGYPDYSTDKALSGGTYTVKRGDSLWAISRRCGVPVRSLAVANGMSINVPIKIGQKLIIPGVTKKSSSLSTGSSVKTPAAPSGKTYTVKSGDSFYKIGKKVGVNYLKLMKYNNATEKTVLHPGQIIKLP